MILTVDTTGAACAVGVAAEGRVAAHLVEEMTRGHAERLFPMIEAALAQAGAGYADIARIAVCTGPGNFTGARIGVSAMRGLALSLGAPAVGATRFEALAEGEPGRIEIRLDGRGGAVHRQIYAEGAALGPVATNAPPDASARQIADGPLDPLRLASIAARAPGDGPRPAPFYPSPPDALPPRETPPPLLP